jgi:uncharacterized protein YbaR (Trm112 family)
MTNEVDAELLEILRCPVTRSRLRQEGDWLIAEVGGLAFPIVDRIPIMLAEDAKLPPGIQTLEEFREKFAVV